MSIKRRGVDTILRILTYIIGIILISIGLTFMLLYTNLFTMGYTFLEYFLFIIKRVECLIIFLGILLIIHSLKGEKQ